MTDETLHVLSDTHAHGIARFVLSSRALDSLDSIARAKKKFDDSDVLATRKGVRRLFSAIHRHLDRYAWAQESWTDRHESRGVWLLPIFQEDQLSIARLTVSAIKNRSTRWRLRTLLRVPLHAIARSHQRLHDGEWEPVEEQLRICSLYAGAVQRISEQHGLKQFGLPAFNGLLVGNVDTAALQAKTFLTPPFAARYQSLLDAWMRFTLADPVGHLDALRALTMQRRSAQTAPMLDLLASELTRPELAFIACSHEPGRDHVGVMWEAAREQARREAALDG